MKKSNVFSFDSSSLFGSPLCSVEPSNFNLHDFQYYYMVKCQMSNVTVGQIYRDNRLPAFIALRTKLRN